MEDKFGRQVRILRSNGIAKFVVTWIGGEFTLIFADTITDEQALVVIEDLQPTWAVRPTPQPDEPEGACSA